jgi:hypothetical protein
MNLIWAGLIFAAGYELGNWFSQIEERKLLYGMARRAASDRPLLVVGNTKGRHGQGDVCIDVQPRGRCVYGDVHALDYPDGHFGAAFVGHVLEHVKDPAAAFAELHRVADQVFVAYPHRHSLIAWLHPTHHWILDRPAQGYFQPLEYERRGLMR